MKNRDGYVSNSSSTSFCIIGVSRWAKWYQGVSFPEVIWEMDGMSLIEEDILECFGYGYEQGKNFDFYGTYDVSYVGVNAEGLLEAMTIPQAKEWFQAEVYRLYSLAIPLSIIKLHTGTEGEG